MVVRPVAEERAVVEIRRMHDLAGIEAVVRIEAPLDLLERAHELRPEHRLVEFRAHDAVAVLARMRALVGAHHVEGFLGDRAHRLDVALEPQVEHRPHMQAADRGMGIPGAARAVLFENVGEPRGIVRQMLERDGAVLDEGDRFAFLLHRHHDVETGGAHLGDGGLQLGIEHLDHPAPFCAAVGPSEAEIADHLVEPPQAAHVLALVVLGELHEQDRGGIAAHDRVDRGLEHRDLAGEPQHGAIDELDRDRPERDDVLRGLHRLGEAAEMAGADRAPAKQGRKLELDPGGERERALGADENVREIEVVAAGHQRVEIVAADPALHLGEIALDRVGLARREREEIARQRNERRLPRQVGEIARDRTETGGRAVRQHGIDRKHVLARVAVAQRTRAAGIVAHHAADGGARGGGDVDRKPQPVRAQPAIELVEHDAGLDRAALAGDVERQHMIEIFRAVDDQRGIHGLAGLRGAGAARQHAHALLARERERMLGLFHRARRDHADRHDLIVRRVGGVAPARERIEVHLAQEMRLEPPFEPGHDCFRHP